ncbi:MAG: bifunctional pyr operon transcriptional regulator/uracil phosphoribosyltransferase PyrR [Chitinophagaceae bacterium]
MKTLLTTRQLDITIQRLCHQVEENHPGLRDVAIIGLQPRGIFLSDRMMARLKDWNPDAKLLYGKLDITFYRDDIRQGLHQANQTRIPFSLENKQVVLVDDVLYTGRTIRAALDALLDYGRPAQVELCVLIDRRFSRHFPIQANYVGKPIDSINSQKVKVNWQENAGTDEVILL